MDDEKHWTFETTGQVLTLRNDAISPKHVMRVHRDGDIFGDVEIGMSEEELEDLMRSDSQWGGLARIALEILWLRRKVN